MTISYPLSFPVSPKPSSVLWVQNNSVAYQVSPYTLQTQVYEYDGEAWGIEISFDPLTREEAAPLIAFIASLRGRLGTFTFGDTLMREPRGAGGGIPLVKGAGQAGLKILTCDGFPNSTLVLKAGDFIQIDYSLYTVLADVTSDGSGNAAVDVWPKLRTHSDNAPIVLSDPKGRFRLSENQVRLIDAGRSALYSIDLVAEEVI